MPHQEQEALQFWRSTAKQLLRERREYAQQLQAGYGHPDPWVGVRAEAERIMENPGRIWTERNPQEAAEFAALPKESFLTRLRRGFKKSPREWGGHQR
jgi:hypothetical protein